MPPAPTDRPTDRPPTHRAQGTWMADYNERCWKHGIIGLVAGFALGGNIGFFFGTIEGAHGEIVGRTFGEQLRVGFARQVSHPPVSSASASASALASASTAPRAPATGANARRAAPAPIPCPHAPIRALTAARSANPEDAFAALVDAGCAAPHTLHSTSPSTVSNSDS